RLHAVTKILGSFIPWNGIRNVLDVGSNRGDFVKWLQTKNLVTDIVAVEPDRNIIDDYKSLPNLTLYIDKLEKINLPSSYFDLVYCAQTLEHAESASAMLEQIQDCMKIGSHLFLEVPNIDILRSDDIVEEFFMDKHKFHFNHSLLRDYLNILGFEIAYDSTDIFNI
ncbi:MAG: class I SAM-dependent methyltransferase, partial [Candidatus Helarchaeota archaeon]